MSFSYWRRARTILLTGVWFGMLTGFFEICLLAIQKYCLKKIAFRGMLVWWMTPVSEIFIFTVFGFFLLIASMRWEKLASLSFVVSYYLFLSIITLLLLANQLHILASLLLAAGLAAQAGRFISGRASRFQKLVSRTVLYMVVLLVSLTLIFHMVMKLDERNQLAKLPPTHPNAPNVLLLVLDTVRAHNLSLYGYSRPTTPNLDELATEAVVFDRALATAPWTLSTHASVFTGRFDHELSVDWKIPLDNTYPTLAEVLRRRGYSTAGFVGNKLYCSRETGLHRGFVHYEDFILSIGEFIRSSVLARKLVTARSFRRAFGYHQKLGRKSAADVNEAFLNWLSKNEQRPFFVFLNYYDAHTPYVLPDHSKTRFVKKSSLEEYLREFWGPGAWLSSKHVSFQSIQAGLDAYDDCIAYIDHHIGLLIDELKARGVLENTLLIVTSDHGEEFAEHLFLGHASSLYAPSLHVPLIISFPRIVPKGKRVHEPVSIADIPSTVLELLRVKNDYHFPGRSLSLYWNTIHEAFPPVEKPVLSEVRYTPGLPKWFPVSKGDMKSLVLGRYHYIRNADGTEELYDWKQDPWEKKNLSDNSGFQEVLYRARASLQKMTCNSSGQ